MIQSGDPSGTGEGGQSIYEDAEFERYDEDWARVCGKEAGEKIVFGDEVHSRLKFNRRGLVGLAKDSVGGYGSQWFVTLGDCRSELDGRMTMFGRVEGEGIYNVVKIAEGERVGEWGEAGLSREGVGGGGVGDAEGEGVGGDEGEGEEGAGGGEECGGGVEEEGGEEEGEGYVELWRW